MDGPEIVQRIPPHDITAEQAVLSCMLSDRDALSLACGRLGSGDFYRPSHREIFDAMYLLYVGNVAVDAVTLSDKLTEKGVFEQTGGTKYISELVGLFYISANIVHYIDIVVEKALFRRLIKASADISAMSYEAAEDADSIIEKAEQAIFNIASKRGERDFMHVHSILVGSIERVEKLFYSKGQITGVPTGFIDFDNKTAGLQPSDLILIASRPAMGKSALALNIAHHAAVHENITTAVFSLEMSKEQVVNRMLCSESLVDSNRLRTGNLDHDDWNRILKSLQPMSESPLYIDDTPGISAAALRAKCRRLKLEKNLGLIIVDYLQLMSGIGRSESRQMEISEISRSMKALAREMDAPVVALSQLSRACEQRNEHRPMLSDLRESGAIEQDADIVTFLYREEYYDKDTDKKNVAELNIAKQRNGSTGTVELLYRGHFTKFDNMMPSP